MRRFVRSVIQNATVTASEASAAIKLDPVLMRAMEVRPFEGVEIVNVATGARFSTWVEEGSSGSVAGANVQAGDLITIISSGWLHDGQTLAHKARVITLDASNTILSITESPS